MPLRKFLGWFASQQKRSKKSISASSLKLCTLEARLNPNGYLAVGADAGTAPWVAIRVDIHDAIAGDPPNSLGQPPAPQSDGKTDFTSQIFLPFVANFHGGVHVATGNFDGLASTPDQLVTAAGPSGGPHVIIWNMKTLADGSI